MSQITVVCSLLWKKVARCLVCFGNKITSCTCDVHRKLVFIQWWYCVRSVCLIPGHLQQEAGGRFLLLGAVSLPLLTWYWEVIAVYPSVNMAVRHLKALAAEVHGALPKSAKKPRSTTRNPPQPAVESARSTRGESWPLLRGSNPRPTTLHVIRPLGPPWPRELVAITSRVCENGVSEAS